MTTNEVIYDDLEYTSEGVFLLHGKPFTGVAYENDTLGNRRCLIPFNEGREHGLVQAFFQNGKLKSEIHYECGRKHGKECEWFSDARLKQESVFEFGVLMTSKEWSADGILEKDYARTPSDHLYKLVVEERKKINSN